MGAGVYLSQARKLRSSLKKTENKVIDALLTGPFSIAFTFNTKKVKQLDFLPVFQKYVKGENLKYLTPSQFKKFKIKDDRIYWGKNEDIVFSIPALLEKSKTSDDIVYII